MNANWSGTISQAKKRKPASGLMISAMVAALLMAAALIGCDDARESGGLTVRAEAVGQDNGSLTDTSPTVREFERLRLNGPTAVDRTPRADARYVSSAR